MLMKITFPNNTSVMPRIKAVKKRRQLQSNNKAKIHTHTHPDTVECYSHELTFVIRSLNLADEFWQLPVPTSAMCGAVPLHAGRKLE